MRELKFRVWSEDQKTYDYKFPYNSIGDFYVSTRGKVFSDFGNTVAPEVRQEAFIVEQYTGLKDKNGKEIYEGDIVKFAYLELAMKPTGVVCFDAGRFFVKDWEFDDGSYHIVDFYDYNIPNRDFKVIGNIHENPELLGDKE